MFSPIDKNLSEQDILALKDVVLDIGGIPVSTHALALAGWKVRVRRKHHSARKVRIVFIGPNNSHITYSARAMVSDMDYIWSALEMPLLTHHKPVYGLNDFTDMQLLQELKRRTSFKRRRKPKTNVVWLKQVMEKYREAA